MSKPNNPPPYSIAIVGWQQAQPQLREIREQVFIHEQNVPVALEWDGLDEDAIHLLALDLQGNAIGCARILAGGIIGRMAVLRRWRNVGLGRALLEKAVDYCRKQKWQDISLSAQTHAIPFYERAGFVVCSEEYMDAGIPHRDMQLAPNPALNH